MDSYYAVTAPGLESYTARELADLGLLSSADAATGTQPVLGGVAFAGDLDALYRANLHLGTASRVLVRLGDPFYAKAFSSLRAKASRLPWERFIRPGQAVAIRATCYKSKLYHSDAVAERIAGAIADRLGRPSQNRKPGDEESDAGAQLVVVRLVHDQVAVSIDSSGDLLHRRGYRLAVAKAPLRETLAAALLIASGWNGTAPLIDPFCGSGTIPIEAARMARGVPPGFSRRFAFMNWPGFDAARWQGLLDAVPPCRGSGLPPIFGSDRDAGAIRMALCNAERAGVSEHIQFAHQAVSALEPPRQTGWIVTNPPYGVRMSGHKELRNLYARFGDLLRRHCRGWQVALLCNDPKLLGQTGIKLDLSLTLASGGLKVILARGRVGA